MRNLLAIILRLPARLLIMLIVLYQKTLSPDHGALKFLWPHGFCRHSPTCSQYALLCLKDQPLFSALLAILKRLAHCTPWTKPSDERLKDVIQRHLSKP